MDLQLARNLDKGLIKGTDIVDHGVWEKAGFILEISLIAMTMHAGLEFLSAYLINSNDLSYGKTIILD
jgi:hypothetical protein